MNSSPCDFHRRNGTHKGKYSAIPGLSGTACAILFFIISMLSLISCSSTDSMIDAVAYREAHRIVEYQEDQVFIYIHGSGDNPSVWADEKVRRFGGIALDWSELSMNKLSAPKKGFEVGVKIASSLGEISPDTQFSPVRPFSWGLGRSGNCRWEWSIQILSRSYFLTLLPRNQSSNLLQG